VVDTEGTPKGQTWMNQGTTDGQRMDNERASKRMTDVNEGTPKKYDEGAGDNA